jgi:endonuclease YncB( thermonuclease family)
MSRTHTLMTGLLLAMLGVLALGFGVFGIPASAGQTVRPVPETLSVPACPPKGITIDGIVVRVIDGDTIVVESRVEYHVRLLDCWAPESRTRDLDEKQRGLAAKARMQQLAVDKPVRVFLPAADDLTDMMTMGRLLGRVWILSGDAPTSPDLSTIMVAEQLATREKLKP